MDAFDAGSDEFKTAKNLFDAYVHNIRQEVFRS